MRKRQMTTPCRIYLNPFLCPPLFSQSCCPGQMLGKKWGIFFATSGLQFFCHSGLQKSQEVGGYSCMLGPKKMHSSSTILREESKYVPNTQRQTKQWKVFITTMLIVCRTMC